MELCSSTIVFLQIVAREWENGRTERRACCTPVSHQRNPQSGGVERGGNRGCLTPIYLTLFPLSCSDVGQGLFHVADVGAVGIGVLIFTNLKVVSNIN